MKTDWVSTTLYKRLQYKKGLVGFHDSWTAFQLELAVDELFFGWDMCSSSRQYTSSQLQLAVHKWEKSNSDIFL